VLPGGRIFRRESITTKIQKYKTKIISNIPLLCKCMTVAIRLPFSTRLVSAFSNSHGRTCYFAIQTSIFSRDYTVFCTQEDFPFVYMNRYNFSLTSSAAHLPALFSHSRKIHRTLLHWPLQILQSKQQLRLRDGSLELSHSQPAFADNERCQ
jgi:hypothetical protein